MVCYIWSDWSEYTNLVVSILVLEEGNHPELNLQIVLSSISMPWDDFAMSMFAPGEIRISVCYWGRWVFNQQGFLWRFNSSRIMGNKCIVHINSFENMFSNQPRKSRSTVILLEGQCPIRSRMTYVLINMVCICENYVSRFGFPDSELDNLVFCWTCRCSYHTEPIV